MVTSVVSSPQRSRFRSVLGFSEDQAVVIGLPSDFNFDSEIAAATEIRLATAFAHLKGWKLIAPAFLRSSASIQLLTGLDFFQTEPKLLREWNRLTAPDAAQPHISARLAKRLTTFHPKILIASSTASPASFAIVGSGNLSFGGLRSNCVAILNARSTPKTLPWSRLSLSGLRTSGTITLLTSRMLTSGTTNESIRNCARLRRRYGKSRRR